MHRSAGTAGFPRTAADHLKYQGYPGCQVSTDTQTHPQPREIHMTKLLSALILTPFAFSAQAASHAGGAPMKADAPMAAASGAHKAKKAHAAKPAKKAAPAASAAKM